MTVTDPQRHPGGARLRPFRPHQLLHRALYTTEHDEPGGAGVRYTVHVDAGREDGKAELYRDGLLHATADMPASFPVPGGAIEVAMSLYGMRRVHLVGDDGRERRLEPAPGTVEHRRHRLAHRHPAISRAIGGTAIVILVVNLVLAVPQALQMVTTIPKVAELVGTFASPVALPAWLNTVLLLAGVVAAAERALMLRHHRVLDFETLWTNF